MDGQWAWIVAVVTAVVGYLVGSSRSKEVIALAQHDFKIKVTKTGTAYKSETDIKRKKVRGSDRVVWRIQDEGSNALPTGSVVFLRFPNGSPLASEQPDDGGRRTIVSHVLFGHPIGDYHYKVYYIHNGVEHLLEDPVLIMEGNRRIIMV